MRRLRLLPAAALMVMAGCLDSTTSTESKAETSPMSASIEGTTWVASAVQVTIDAGAGTFAIAGGGASTNTTISLVVNATAPGTYSLGAGGAGSAVVALSTGQSWTSAGVGGSGSLMITALGND